MTWQDILKVKRTTNILNARKIRAYLDKRMRRFPEGEIPSDQSIASALGMTIEDVKSAKELMFEEGSNIDTDLNFEKKEEKPKPDFIDLDKDGNTKEPMRQAAKDAKKRPKPKNPFTRKD